MKKMIFAAFLSLIFSGCSLPFKFGGSEKTYYLLNEASEEFPRYSHREKQLIVRDMLAPGFLDSHRIVFARSRSERGYYQFASWTELPSKRIADLLLNRIRQSGMFAAASRAMSGAAADYQLNTELNDFVHELAGGGEVHVTISAEVLDLRSRYVIGSQKFSAVVQVSSNDAESAVRGFEKALAEVDAQVVEWLDRTVPREGTPSLEDNKEAL